MAKLIKSFAIVIAVGTIAGMATYSFFSDEEKSTGNTFTAGKIDLKVDSESHYNGMVCEGGFWVDPKNCNPTGNNLIANGGFESPVVNASQLWDIFPSVAGNWNVEWEDGSASYSGQDRPEPALLELHKGVLGPPAEGLQSTELDTDWFGPSNPLNGEPASVRIYQNIATTAGKSYQLKYQFSPRPNTPASDNELAVRIDGVQVDLVTAAGVGTVNWAEHQYTFTATGSSTKIEFADLGDPNSLGTFLDDVSVREIECLKDGPCDGTWGLTDLISGTHKFFNFTDIKPGDEGEDTVSLHVFDNDAWGRLVINKVTDIDNTCVDPELAPTDSDCTLVCTAPGCAITDGELRENLEFWVWLDEGQTPGFQNNDDPGEGDNKKQENEIMLIQKGPIDIGSETHNIWQGLGTAYASHSCTDPDGNTNYGPCHGLAQDGHMVQSATYYFGIGWELPEEVGNEAQTDIFSADMTFEVEQYRNNPSPF